MSARSSLDLKTDNTNIKAEPDQLIDFDSTAVEESPNMSNSIEPETIEKETTPAKTTQVQKEDDFDEFPVPDDNEFPVPDDNEFPVPDDNDFPAPDDDEFDDFGSFDNEATNNDDDDDFGDFNDFEEATESADLGTIEPEEPEPMPKTPTEAELYVDILEHNRDEMNQFIESYLQRMWEKEGLESCLKEEEQLVSSPIEKPENPRDILNTPCSRDLWTKLSRDTVFYNPVTGAVGQFQWTRSETNKSYLNALGVTFNYEEKSPMSVHSPTSSPTSANATKKRQSNIVDGKRLNNGSTSSLPSPTEGSHTHLRSASATAGGLRVVTSKMDETAKEAKKEADQEMELDIDIARAYCELTEETIRVFPDVKLNAMVIELSRLQRQAADYLDNLLDQREQLKMDAETYNDLISCIVGHAQRLHVQNKDGSPAMVSKKKKSNSTFSNIMRRKTTTSSTQSASMGGGVVGVKQAQQQAPVPKRTMSSAAQIVTTSESRRSM